MKTLYTVVPQSSAVVARAIMAVREMWFPEWETEQVELVEEAGLVFVIDDRQALNRIYREVVGKKVVVFFEKSGKGLENLPQGVVGMHIDVPSSILPGLEAVQKLLDGIVPQLAGPVIAVPDDVEHFSRSYRVLVVDDTPEHLELAQAVLAGHEITTAHGFEEGMRLLKGDGYDAVLTDLKMPENGHYKALAPQNIRPDVFREYGFLMAFEATLLRIPVAIVTDGNHHHDWTSAAFDRFHDIRMNMNGRDVLFFNDIGKRWDKALKALVESTTHGRN